MPLTGRGRAIIDCLPMATFAQESSAGCEIVRHQELCVGCGRCGVACPSGAIGRSSTFDVAQLLAAPPRSRRGELAACLRRISRHEPGDPVGVPDRVAVFRTVTYDVELCLGCGACSRACPTGAVEAFPPEVPE